jgi:uncharacterized protein
MKRIATSRILCAALVAALLASCSSVPPPRFHTLMPAPTTATTQARPSGPVAWEVLPVGIPAQVDQPQWVVRAADGSLAVLEQERWIAPLADEIRAAIAARLTQLLGAPAPAPTSRGLLRVRVDLQRFDASLGGESRLEATWSVRADDAAGAPSGCQGVFVQATAGASYTALARAHQQTVAALAEAIGASVAAAGKGQGVACS